MLCHTDACLGGWLLPLLERLGEPMPPWDFRVEGVTSLSADVHKYGWCTSRAPRCCSTGTRTCCGASTSWYDDWPGGLYGSATTAGTRPAAPIAAAWAALNHLGEEGYLRLAREVRDTAARLRTSGSRPSRACGSPATRSRACWRSRHDGEGVDIGAVGDVMDDRGWHLDRQQGGLHVMVSPYHAPVADRVPRRPGRPRWPARPTARAGASRPATAGWD